MHVATKIELRDRRPVLPPAAARIFAEGIATRNATFETEAPSWTEWDRAHLGEHRLVAFEGDRILGWIALAPYSARGSYAGVAEVSVYVDSEARGIGVGASLLEAVIGSSERGGIWTLRAGVFPENLASVALFQRVGFRVLGRQERIGQLDGVWRDVLLLERPSEVVT